MGMKNNIPDQVAREISTFAQKHRIQRVILFGSRARGTHTERSDIDIAVSGGNVDAFYWDIKENVFSLLMFDIVELDAGVSEELKKEIERDGIMIYEEAH
jgi:predicted nucleotidyltransferase